MAMELSSIPRSPESHKIYSPPQKTKRLPHPCSGRAEACNLRRTGRDLSALEGQGFVNPETVFDYTRS